MSDVIAAIATGRQPCAIGVLRLSGEGCAETAGKVFLCKNGKPLSEAPDKRLTPGTLYDLRGREIDHCLAVCSRAPHSYTGEDTVELQCHGSPAVLSAALEALSSGPKLGSSNRIRMCRPLSHSIGSPMRIPPAERS